MNPLKSDEYPVSWEPYIEVVNKDPKDVLKEQLISFPAFLASIPPEKAEYAYAEGKWTIKEVVGHVIDTERIMAYRALRFARNDTQSLPGYDEETFVQNAHFNDYSLEHYSEEFTLLRKSNLMLIESFNTNELLRSGLANDRLVSVRALVYVIAGHLAHHRSIIQDRYLNDI
ncbi:DinB family protein [Albibacterium bauzanense]|uniref:DinB family protein n=1 Tax=Albibacterium bauzanense TaxID=653929 RepID=A0A4R1LZD5_9SPHI|nr:DinB family protein [Albibacterium bauzanense]TCK82733.1 DinB family protein [Albibacterium bauzanense]